MSHPGGISATPRLNPPVALVAEDYVELSIAITVNGEQLDGLNVCPAEVVGIFVGSPSVEVKDGLEGLPELKFLDADGALRAARDVAEPASTLADALTRFVSWAEATGHENPHLFLFVSRATIENGEHLTDCVENLRNQSARCDIFATSAQLDFRLLGQVALMGGGRFYVGPDRSWLDEAQKRLHHERNRRFFDVRLGIRLTSNLIPINAFRVDPAPIHTRDFQVQPSGEVCWFDLPSLASSQDEYTWLLRCLAPRKRAGEYRVLDYELVCRTSEGALSDAGMIRQQASSVPGEANRIDAWVESQIDATRSTQWVEAVGQAYMRGDGGKIVSTFGPFMQHESLNGRHDNVQRLWTLKQDLIRGGYFGLRELNTMWCLAQNIDLGDLEVG